MAVSTTESFLDLLAASNLLSRAQIEMLRANAGDDPKQFATRLVKQNLLTRWQASQLLSGKSKLILGRYKLLEAIGRGGMGTVLKAEQIGIGREVALKLMSKAVLKNPDAVTRFLREIRSAAALNHPNIVAAYDASSEGSQYFLVMEYVNGRDLKEWIRKHRRLPIDWACECVRQAAEGLQHAHEHGMVHRDIKPANLLVVTEADGTKPVVKILDMGLARFTSENTGTDAGLTQTGQVMGTPDYIAPEQARNTRDADIRSDIFSLGCTLFELLAGEVPYGGQNVMEKLMARAVDDAPRVRSRRPEIPAELDRIVARMLARDANDRFQTPGEVAAALAPFAAGGTGAKQSPPPIAAPEAARTTGSAARDSTLNEFLDQLGDTAPGTARATAENQPVEQKRRGARKPAPWMLIGGGTIAALVLTFLLMDVGRTGTVRKDTAGKTSPRRTGSTETIKTPPEKPAADPQRDVANWVLQEGGSVTVLLSDQQMIDAGNVFYLDPNANREKPASKATDLPSGPLRLVEINLDGRSHVTSIGLRRLRNAPDVQRLYVSGTQVTGDGLEHLTGMKELRQLFLHQTSVRGAGFAHLKGLSKLEMLHIGQTEAGDIAVKHIGELSSLRQLWLDQTPVSDAGMAALSGLTRLEVLSLTGMRLTDEGLRPLGGMTRLRELNIDGMPVTDAGLLHLQNCTELSILRITGTNVSGAGLAHLRQAKSLYQIYLGFASATDDGLQSLKFFNLNRIDLIGTRVTDAVLPHLAHMSNLAYLDLSQTQISDAAIPLIAKMKQLQFVYLNGTGVTASGVSQLRKALPDCRINP